RGRSAGRLNRPVALYCLAGTTRFETRSNKSSRTSNCYRPRGDAGTELDGIINGMKTTIDNAGRLVIPKEIRKQAGLKPGMPLEVRVRDGCIEIEPAPIKIQLQRKGRFVVAVPTEAVPTLTASAVEETRQRLRHERGSKD